MHPIRIYTLAILANIAIALLPQLSHRIGKQHLLHASSTPPPPSPSSSSNLREDQVRSNLKETREKYTGVFPDISEQNNNNNDQFISSLKTKRSYLSILLERTMQTLDDTQIATKMKELKALKTAIPKENREKIVVLGSGWGAHAFLKTIDASVYDVVTISPRNYFLFTPMLAASAVGTVEFRSLCEPIRNANPLANYVEATAIAIDPSTKSIECRSVKCSGISCETADFTVNYDYLVIAVGATTNTFGIPGVREYCQFLKQIEDASSLRTAILYCFERANVPGLSTQEITNALSFIIVGAGPTGVEFTSELRDFVESEGKRYYSKLLKYVSIRLIEAGDAVLPVFDKALQLEALSKLVNRKTSLIEEGLVEKEITQVILKTGVKQVSQTSVLLNSGEDIPYGFCVWAAGNGPVPLVLDLINSISQQREEQNKARGRLVTDTWLRVAGLDSVLCIGDCGYTPEIPLPATAQVASQQGSYLGRLLSKGYSLRATVPCKDVVSISTKEEVPLSERFNLGELGVQSSSRIMYSSIDSSARNSSTSDGIVYAKPFQFLNLGVLAYIGASEALTQVSVDEKQILGSGPIGFLLWRGIYWAKQVSWRNRILVGVDWVKARVFGRDIGAL